MKERERERERERDVMDHDSPFHAEVFIWRVTIRGLPVRFNLKESRFRVRYMLLWQHFVGAWRTLHIGSLNILYCISFENT